MANFPPLQIADISVGYGNKNEEFLVSQSGETVAIDSVSSILGTTIDVSFHLERTGLNLLWAHYNEQKSSFIGFLFTSATLIEVDVPAAYSWIYTSKPVIEDVYGNLSYVRCQFKLVPRGGILFVPGADWPISIQFYAAGAVVQPIDLGGIAIGSLEGADGNAYCDWPIAIQWEADGFIQEPIDVGAIAIGPLEGSDAAAYCDWPIALSFGSPPLDPDPGSTILLVRYEQDFKDSSANNWLYTLYGNPQIIQGGGYNNANHGSFDGSSWVIYSNVSAIFGDLTVETYAYPTNISDKIIFSHSGGINTQGFRHWPDGSISVYWEGAEIKSSSGVIQVNNWYHYAFTREVVVPGQTISRLFVDGILVATSNIMSMNIKVDIIGAMYAQGNLNQGTEFVGKLNETRVKNACLYKTNFTPPPPFTGG